MRKVKTSVRFWSIWGGFDVTAAMKWNFWEWGRTRYLVQEKTLQEDSRGGSF
jgi:hypothetical protein